MSQLIRTLLYKSGQKDNVNNYTPTSVLHPFSKVIEKLIKTRLTSFITRNDIVYQRQSGFRKKFTTIYSIIDVVNDCFDNINNKKLPCAIALHIKKAFGLVDHNILVNKLEHYGIRGVSLKLFSNYQAIDKNMYALIIINPLWQKLNLVYHCRKIGNCITSLTGRLIRIV